VVPVFGGESISTPFVWGRTRGCRRQFQDFLAVHKLSTVRRKLSPSKPRFSTGSPQMEAGQRWLHACPGRAARKRTARKDRPGQVAGDRRVSQETSRTVRTSSAKPQEVSASQEISRTRRTNLAKPEGVSPSDRRHAKLQARVRPSPKGQRVRQEIGRGAHAGRAACDRTGRSRTTGAAPRAGPQG
jgi:hypothetical protein